MAGRVGWKGALLALIFALNLILVSPDLMPILPELNPHDETKYIDSGRSLVNGYLRGLQWSPLSSFLYAPIYLAVRNSADWFVRAAALGRVVLFSLLWYSFTLLGSRFSRSFPVWVVPGVLLVGSTLTRIVHNPSDALFAIASALALARMIAFSERHRRRELWLGSLFMGLAILSRNDGLFLFPLFLVAAILLGRRHLKLPYLLAAALIPAFLLVGVYVLVLGWPAGEFNLGTGYRGYTAYTWSLENNFRLTPRQVGELIGTAEENSFSVPRAIRRNPGAFAGQVQYNINKLPDALLSTYGKRLAPPLFYFALAGIFWFWKRGRIIPLGLLLLWPVHSMIYLGFYIRSGFLLLDHVVVILLAAAGIYYLVAKLRTPALQLAWAAPLLGLAVYGLVDGKPAFLAAGLIPFLGLWLGWLSIRLSEARSAPILSGLLILLAAGLMLRDGYSFPNFPSVGETPMERAVHFIEDSFPRGARVYSLVPLPPLAARMTPMEWGDIQSDFRSGMSICDVLDRQEIRALYVTPQLIQQQPDLWAALQDAEGDCIERAFLADPGSIQVLSVGG